MRPDFLVDVDEVLCDFHTPAFDLIKKITGRVYTSQDFDAWDIFSVLDEQEADKVFELMEQPGFCASLQPRAGAVEFIWELREYANVYVVTSPQHNRHWVYERTEWLREHFNFQKKDIIHTAAKFMVRGDALLDDKPEHIENWAKRNPDGMAMLWHTANTRNQGQGLYRVKTWLEVLEVMRPPMKRVVPPPTLEKIQCTWCHQLIVPDGSHSCSEQDAWDDNEDAAG